MKLITRSPDELGKSIPLDEGERYVIVVRPRAVVFRFSGLVFDTNKNFILPGCIPLLKSLKPIYEQRPDNKLLIVGHTDTSGEPDYNDELSLERARAVEAYLNQDDGAWLARYQTSVQEKKRWGELEDRQMIGALPRGETDEEDPVRAFQATRSLKVDGIIGNQTRTALIKEYMLLGDAKPPATVTITVHGCGENFPLDDSGLELDPDPADDAHDPLDRRVELYFFDGEIKPPPPGPNSKPGSKEYPEWRKLAKLVFDRALGPLPVLKVRMLLQSKPLANETYELRVEGHLIAVSTTDADGLIQQVVPHNAELAEIRMLDLELVRTLTLAPEKDFPSVDDLRGVQIRLNQLGFFAGEADGEPSALTDDAVQSFKREQGLADDTVLDDATRKALTAAYGS